MARVFFTATSRFFRPNLSAMPESSPACDTKLTEVAARAPPSAPNIGR